MIDLTQEEIMKNWGVDNSNNPLVSIKCMTYNHENYIAQCIDGFLMQKTNFPFEILIHDDCSTDKTESIVRDYETKFSKIIKGIYETENQWQKGCGAHHTKIDAAIKGKYIAICEGDDYWIDENKLQMQVDFLENNPEYGMCYTRAMLYNQSEQKFSTRIYGSEVKSYEDLYINGNKIITLTTMYKKDLLYKYQNEVCPNDKGWLMGDLPMWLYFSKSTKMKFMNEATGVYRCLEESASHTNDLKKKEAFRKSSETIRRYFAEKYGEKHLLHRYIVFEEFLINVEKKMFCKALYCLIKQPKILFSRRSFILYVKELLR